MVIRNAEKFERVLPDGRIRVYKKFRPAKKQGEMIGSRFVKEYNPRTGKKRSWNEVYDSNGRVRIVRPENGRNKVHYMFDKEGNYIGKW